MLFTKGMELWHIISQAIIEVSPAMIELIKIISIPKTPKEVLTGE